MSRVPPPLPTHLPRAGSVTAPNQSINQSALHNSPLNQPFQHDDPHAQSHSHTVKLWSTREQQAQVEHLADLYALIMTIDRLERAYLQDVINDLSEYTSTCNRLIGQYKTLRDTLGPQCPDLDQFCSEHGIDCRAARTRLKQGIPATMLHGHSDKAKNNGYVASLIFKTTQSYITLLDALKLGMRAVDQLAPLASDIVTYINQLTDMPPDHEARKPVVDWLLKLNSMKAHEELTSEQARQCEFDLQKAYDAIYRFLEEKDKQAQT